MKPTEFKSLCEEWNKKEALAHRKGFYKVFCDIIKEAPNIGVTHRELSHKFGMPESWVGLYARSRARPHPYVQEVMVSYLKKKAEAAIAVEGQGPAPGR